jgi:hypothetical protein
VSDVAAAPASPLRPSGRYHCELDDWTFDARYTDGRCPICGWQPDGAPVAPPWLSAARRFEWELTGLFVLLIVLAVLGAVVASAAGYRFPLVPAHHPAATTVTQASGARPAHSTPAPRQTPAGSPRPSPSP